MIEMKKEVKEMIKIIVTEKGKSLSPLYFLIELESVILFRTFSYPFFNVYRYFLFIWRWIEKFPTHSNLLVWSLLFLIHCSLSLPLSLPNFVSHSHSLAPSLRSRDRERENERDRRDRSHSWSPLSFLFFQSLFFRPLLLSKLFCFISSPMLPMHDNLNSYNFLQFEC